MQRIKKSLAVLLCMLLTLTPVVAAAPSITADAARNTSISFTDNLNASRNTTTKEYYYVLTAEVGQAFNIGDYIDVNASSKVSKLSGVSTTATYKTSNQAVATISKKGAISAKAVGSTVITTKYKGKTLKVNLNVTEAKYSTNAVIADYKATLDAAAKTYKKFSSIKASNAYAFVNAVTGIYTKSLAVEKEINNDDFDVETGILSQRTTTATGYEYDNHIVVTNGTVYNTLYSMLKSYSLMNNPFNTSSKYNSELNIKSVSGSATGLTVDLKSKVTQAQAFGALGKYSLSYLRNFTLDKNFAPYVNVTVYKMKQNANGRLVRDTADNFKVLSTKTTYTYSNGKNGEYTDSDEYTDNSITFSTNLSAGLKTLNFTPTYAYSYYYTDGTSYTSSTAYTYDTLTAGTYRAYVSGSSSFYFDFVVK